MSGLPVPVRKNVQNVFVRPFALVHIINIFWETCQINYSKIVNPFIGTGGHGHTFPGVCAPFGMMQLSPDTRHDGWDGCGGYHYSDSLIYGFSHTHLSGTGCSDFGDILLMPTPYSTAINLKNYEAKFSHKNEKASAGYYKVKFDNGIILADLEERCKTYRGFIYFKPLY